MHLSRQGKPSRLKLPARVLQDFQGGLGIWLVKSPQRHCSICNRAGNLFLHCKPNCAQEVSAMTKEEQLKLRRGIVAVIAPRTGRTCKYLRSCLRAA